MAGLRRINDPFLSRQFIEFVKTTPLLFVLKKMVSHNYKKKYPDGIALPFWLTFVVPQVRKIKGYKCEECGSNKNLDFHHTRKDLINIDTLKLLCRKCHKAKHKRQKC